MANTKLKTKQRLEAIKRLEKLGIDNGFVELLKNKKDFIFYNLSTEQNHILKYNEENYLTVFEAVMDSYISLGESAYVYCIIEDSNYINILYVSKYIEDWEYDLYESSDTSFTTTAYVYSKKNGFAECGDIHLKKVDNELIRFA